MRLDAGTEEIDLIIANSRLMNILLLIYRDAVSIDNNEHETSKSKQKHLVAQAKKYIDRFFRNPLRLEDVAEHLQVSPFYLSRIFSRESDFSLIEYLTDARMNEAKKILSSGRYIVADVAKMVGYEDGNYFSKVFKRQTGCSPCKYK
jgi:two-component system response regulator YesN